MSKPVHSKTRRVRPILWLRHPFAGHFNILLLTDVAHHEFLRVFLLGNGLFTSNQTTDLLAAQACSLG